jgi:hypothetical protein
MAIHDFSERREGAWPSESTYSDDETNLSNLPWDDFGTSCIPPSSQTVGNATQFVVEGSSIDDWVFGISAVGPSGHESLISAYVPRPRADAEIKFAR